MFPNQWGHCCATAPGCPPVLGLELSPFLWELQAGALHSHPLDRCPLLTAPLAHAGLPGNKSLSHLLLTVVLKELNAIPSLSKYPPGQCYVPGSADERDP